MSNDEFVIRPDGERDFEGMPNRTRIDDETTRGYVKEQDQGEGFVRGIDIH